MEETRKEELIQLIQSKLDSFVSDDLFSRYCWNGEEIEPEEFESLPHIVDIFIDVEGKTL